MKTLFIAVALLAIAAPLTLADGQQDYPPPDQQYPQQLPPDPSQGGYQQPPPDEGGYQQPAPSQAYPPDQSPSGAPEGSPQAGYPDTQPQGDDQAGDDQAGDGSDGGYSVDSVGQDRPGHKKKRSVGQLQAGTPEPGPAENWGLPPFTGHTMEEWQQYQQQNAAALARQKAFVDSLPECPSTPHEDGQPEIDLHESCRVGITKEEERSRQAQKKQMLDYATNEYGKCMQHCSVEGQACLSPSQEQWTHGHNDCRGEYDRCTAECRDMYNARVTPHGFPAK